MTYDCGEPQWRSLPFQCPATNWAGDIPDFELCSLVGRQKLRQWPIGHDTEEYSGQGELHGWGLLGHVFKEMQKPAVKRRLGGGYSKGPRIRRRSKDL